MSKRKTVGGVRYKHCAEYFDQLKISDDDSRSAPFFAPKEDIHSQIQFESWSPTNIKGSDWVDAFIIVTWEHSMDFFTTESILLHDTVCTKDGLFSKVNYKHFIMYLN